MHESMFETWLKTAHQNDKKAADERTLVEAMKKLPPEVLFKLANGEVKLGSSYPCSSGGGCEGMEWVEQFKETPFFETALQLEQQAIQLEQMEQQHRAQRDAEREQEPKFWEMQDRIRLQKRLLGLQLAAGQLQQAGAAAPGPAGAPLAPPPPEAPPPEAAGAAPPTPMEGKVAFARAAELGRQMATGDYDRAVMTNAATELGRDLAKTALDVGALAGLGQKAVGFLGKNPGAALGAAAGAAGGLAHGLQKDPQGQRHVLSGLAQGAVGAAGGAAAGHAAQSIHGALRGGASLGQAAKGAGQQVQQAAGQAVTHVQGALKPAAAAAGAAPATSAAAAPATRALAPTLSMGQGRVAPTQPAASKNPSLMAATNQALSFQRAPAGVQAAVKSNPLVASGEIPPEAAHQLMSWSAKGGMTPQAVAQMNSKTPRPTGFVDPREAATRVGG